MRTNGQLRLDSVQRFINVYGERIKLGRLRLRVKALLGVCMQTHFIDREGQELRHV